MSEKDGGPAFPTDYTTETHVYSKAHAGMSLRAYVATAAIKKIDPWDFRKVASTTDFQEYAENIAKTAIGIADALIAELAKA